MRYLRNIGWLVVIIVVSSLLFAQQSNAPINYFYDNLGRLVRVVDANGNVATYNYDAVGNILSITRSTISGLGIFSFTPQQGSVSQTVTLQGQGFSTTPSSNTAKFNGTAAAVSAATATSLTVTVPAGAATGPISVTVGTQTATSTTNFTVIPATLVSVVVSPSAATLVQVFTPTQQLTATAIYSNGVQQDVTTAATWTSSSPAVSITPSGLATVVSNGAASIMAVYNGVTGFGNIKSVSLTGYAVTPQLPPYGPTIPSGTTLQFTATGTYSDGSTQNLTSKVVWSSIYPSVATIGNALGTQGLADGVSPGYTLIGTTYANVGEGYTTLNVTQGYPVSLSISPANLSVPKGIQQSFKAIGAFPDGSYQDLTTQVTWSSSNPAVATISNATGSQGVVTDIEVGTTTITASVGTVSNSAALTLTPAVPASMTVSPAAVALQPGVNAPLTAKLVYTDNTTQDVTQSATWSSSSTSIATVSNSAGSQGLVTGVAAGSATITATSGSISGSASAIVSNPNTNLYPRFLYTGNGDGSISTYGIASSTGQLRLNGSSPGVAATVFALDPQQQFLFGAGNAVFVYALNASNGSLTQVTGSPFAITGVSPTSVVTDPSGKFLYVGYRNSALVSGFAVDRTTGALTALPGSPYTTAGYSDSLLVHSSGKYLFVTNLSYNVQGSVSVFAIDSASGALTEISGSPFPVGVDPVSLAQDPAGKFLLVSNSGQNFGSSLRPIDLPGNIEKIEVASRHGSSSLSGLISAGGQSGWLSGFGSSPASAERIGTLVASVNFASAFPFATAGVSSDLMPSVPRIFPLLQSGSHTGPGISVFAVNATSGTLTEVSGSPFTSTHLNNFADSLAMNPSGRFAYVVADGSLVGFSLDSNTGALTELADSPYAAPYTYYATWDPTGQFLYAWGQSAQTGMAFVQGFGLNSGTGTLTSVGNFAARSLASALAVTSGATAVSYSPQFAFVASGATGANGIAAYSIDPTAGTLTPLSGSPFADDLSPVFTTSTSSGKYLYVVNQCSDPTCSVAAGSVSVYAVDPSTGSPTAIPGSPFLAGGTPVGITFDPSGQFAYVANAQDGTVSIYSVDPSSGALTPISGSPFPASSGIVAAAVAPFESQFLLAAKCPTCANGSLYVYGLYSPNIGQWAGLNQTLTLGSPTALAVDPAGNFTLVTDALSNSVSVFTGANTLTQVAGSPFATGQNPVSIALDPAGRFVFIANQASNNVSAYTIDPVSGLFTPIPGSPFVAGTGPISVTVDYSGKFLYVVNAGDSTVSAFTINQVSGALTPVTSSPFPASGAPVSVTTTGKIQ